MNPEIDHYINKASQWQNEMTELRKLLLDCNLTEELKWRAPCYSHNQGNVAMIGSFKDFVSLSFFKGVLLKDTKKMLVAPGENSNHIRMFKFTNLSKIIEQKELITNYIYEAIEVEKAGLKVEVPKNNGLDFPEELHEKFREMPDFEAAFMALTPGRQRGYNIHFTGSKNSATRAGRIEKVIPRIMDGFGMHDCVCGHSKKMPSCDGSHKYL